MNAFFSPSVARIHNRALWRAWQKHPATYDLTACGTLFQGSPEDIASGRVATRLYTDHVLTRESSTRDAAGSRHLAMAAY